MCTLTKCQKSLLVLGLLFFGLLGTARVSSALDVGDTGARLQSPRHHRRENQLEPISREEARPSSSFTAPITRPCERRIYRPGWPTTASSRH